MCQVQFMIKILFEKANTCFINCLQSINTYEVSNNLDHIRICSSFTNFFTFFHHIKSRISKNLCNIKLKPPRNFKLTAVKWDTVLTIFLNIKEMKFNKYLERFCWKLKLFRILTLVFELDFDNAVTVLLLSELCDDGNWFTSNNSDTMLFLWSRSSLLASFNRR